MDEITKQRMDEENKRIEALRKENDEKERVASAKMFKPSPSAKAKVGAVLDSRVYSNLFVDPVRVARGPLLVKTKNGEVKAEGGDVVVTIAGEKLVLSEAQYRALGGDYELLFPYEERVQHVVERLTAEDNAELAKETVEEKEIRLLAESKETPEETLARTEAVRLGRLEIATREVDDADLAAIKAKHVA